MMGRYLEQFEILEELGRGGMGAVYRARDHRLHRDVALKILPDELSDVAGRERFLREARAAAALRHPAIVTVYEIGAVDGVDFIAMELVEGRTLDSVRVPGGLDEERVLRIAKSIADALGEAHAAGIIHRDLKPANIMVTANDVVKILDFGLAKAVLVGDTSIDDDTPTLEAATVPGTVLGTPAYMSPEQARGQRVDHRSDFFSLGCVLFELLIGSRAYSGSSATEIIASILRDPPPVPTRSRSGLHPGWDRVMAGLMAKEAADRYSGVDALFEDLKVMADGTGSRKGRRPILIAAIVTVLVIVGLAVGSRFRPRDTDSDSGTSGGFPEYSFRLLTDTEGSRREPTLSPDGTRVAYMMEDENGVSQLRVFDIDGDVETQITFGERHARNPFWADDGWRILFAVDRRGIWEVSPEGGEPRQILDRGAVPALSRDGRWLSFTHDRQPWIAKGDGSDPRPLEGFESNHFGAFLRADFAPDGNHLVLFRPHDDKPLGDLWVASVDGGAPRKITDLDFQSWLSAPRWTSDGRWIVFTGDHRGANTLWRVPCEGGEAEAITSGAGADLYPDISSDMRRLVYSHGRSMARIEVFDPAERSLRVAFERRSLLIAPALSPAGGDVAFFSRAPRGFHLFIADIDSGDVRQITDGAGVLNTHPAWSWDGASLYYYQQEPEYALRRVDLRSGTDELVISDWRWIRQTQAQPSPDGTSIVYSLRDGGRVTETLVRNLGDGTERSLRLPLHEPRWAADGRRVYGTTWKPYQVVFCEVRTGACESVTEGWKAMLAPDESTLFVLRSSPPRVWRRDMETGDEEQLFTLERYNSFDFNWGVAPGGELVHHAQTRDEFELWIGEALAGAEAPGF